MSESLGYVRPVMENVSVKPGSGFLRWFSESPSPPEAEKTSETLASHADRELLERISDFLLGNRLEVSQANLLTAHAAFSGAVVGLAHTISAKVAAGEKITQSMMDHYAASALPGKSEEMDSLAAKVERTLAVFEQTSSSAKKSTKEYGEVLHAQASNLSANLTHDLVLQNLVEITKTMIERTDRIEKEMERSEKEASSLRASLEKARREADLDHLTGLANRRAFEGVFESQYRIAQSEIEPLSVAFCDIDHFKSINDKHGHDTGDRVIQSIAQALTRISDDKCHVARHGGEEFVLLFRGISLDEAWQKLDDTRKQFAARKLINRLTDEPIGHVTFSAGIANVFAFDDRREALRAADLALYKAKDSGRNCIVKA